MTSSLALSKKIQFLSWSAFTTVCKQHWLAMVVVALGTWLRFTQLPQQGILLSSHGHDLLTAAAAVDHHQWPPFQPTSPTIWLEMVIYTLVGYQPTLYYWVFAGIGSVTLVALYEFCLVWLNRRVGLIALTLASFSPLAIAHSRMLSQATLVAFGTVISLWLVAKIWQRHFTQRSWLKLGIILLCLISLGFFNLDSSAALSPNRNIIDYLSRSLLVVTSQGWQLLILAVVSSFLAWTGYRWWRQGRPLTAGTAAVGLLVVASLSQYFLHFLGMPFKLSEAYFASYWILLPLLLALNWNSLPQRLHQSGGVALVILSLVNSVSIYSYHFFVDQTNGWSYGPSFGTQHEIIKWATSQTDRPLRAMSEQPVDTLAAYIWLSQSLGTQLITSSELETHQQNVVTPRLLITANSSTALSVDSTRFTFTSFHGGAQRPKTLHFATVTARVLP